MCILSDKIKFCTCSKTEETLVDFADEIQKLYSRKQIEAIFARLDGNYMDTYFKWTLKRFREDASASTIGSIVGIREKLTEQLTQENVCKLLNSENVFDFEYTPEERDLIEIREYYSYLELETEYEKRRPYIETPMHFKFEDGQWKIGRYKLGFLFDDLKKGKLKEIK